MDGFGMVGALGVVALGMVVFIWLVGALAFLFWLWALIDILRSEFTGSNKIVWLVAVILLPLLGAALYWFIGREQRTGGSGRLPPGE